MAGGGSARPPVEQAKVATNPKPKHKAKSDVPVAAAAAQMMMKNGQPPALTSLDANRAATPKLGR